ncbi:MAG: hypothetical protein AB1540_01735 [Bdellovibrionota bacterium]
MSLREATPQLDRPGAGIPFFERMVARYVLLPRLVWRRDWEDARALFEKEQKKILLISAGLSEEQMDLKVLIDRIRGIEDSSRFWSVSMTMEHLEVVGRAITAIICDLANDKQPSIEVDIANAKPKKNHNAKSARADFEKFCIESMNEINTRAVNKNSRLKFPHPWFGPLSAHQWHGLMAAHQALHRKQIQLIVDGLGH